MVQTVGQMLQAARGERKLSLEDASRATKIRSRQLADLERDVYSNFPNLAYAKGFLISYGKYLNVDVRPYLDSFEDANTFGLDNYQYLSEVPLGLYRATRRPTRRRSSNRRPYTVLAVALVVMVLTTVAWQLYVNYERLGDLDQLAERQEARENGVNTGSKPAPAATTSAPATATVGAAAAATAVAPAPLPSSAGSGVHAPTLPLPNDGGALRQLLAGAGTSRTPLLMFEAADPRAASAEQKRPAEHGAWSPENLEGYRFYVRSMDRNSVEIFRTGVPRPETVLNNPL